MGTPNTEPTGSRGQGVAATAAVVWVYRRRRQWLEEWPRGEGSSELFDDVGKAL